MTPSQIHLLLRLRALKLMLEVSWCVSMSRLLNADMRFPSQLSPKPPAGSPVMLENVEIEADKKALGAPFGKDGCVLAIQGLA